MTRFLVSMDDADLKTADALAAQLRISRSELVRRALTSYTGLRRVPEQITPEVLARRRAAGVAMDKAAKILSQDKDWNPVQIIRDMRDGKYR